MLSRFDLVLLFLVTDTMAVKPYDAGDFALGIAGALVAAGLVYWRAQAAGARRPDRRRLEHGSSSTSRAPPSTRAPSSTCTAGTRPS